MIIALLLIACQGEPIESPVRPGVVRHIVPTDDGANVVLHDYQGSGTPVLVVHGISSNHRCWDLSPERSLADYLRQEGFDPWLLDLRGHGDAMLDPNGERQRMGWSMDDYGLHDLPAAIDYVRQQTGAEQIAYVGHSLGGMVGAIYASSVPGAGDALSSLIAVGSPVDFSDPDPVMWGALKLAQHSLVPVVPSDIGGDLRAQMGPGKTPVDQFVDQMLFNDIAPDVRPEMYRQIASPMTRGELQQLGRIGQDGFRSASGEVSYVDGLANVDTPTLVIAGRADEIAPVDRVVGFYNAVGSSQKELVVAGRGTGFAVDYGHLDLALGDHAREEIYPLIAGWVRSTDAEVPLTEP